MEADTNGAFRKKGERLDPQCSRNPALRGAAVSCPIRRGFFLMIELKARHLSRGCYRQATNPRQGEVFLAASACGRCPAEI